MNKPTNDKKIWSKEDNDFLSEYWGQYNIETLANKLNRSIRALEHHSTILKLGSLYTNNGRLNASDVSKILGVSRSTICYWIKNKNLPACKKVFKSQSIFNIDYTDLYLWLQNNPHLWNASNVEYMGLGIEPKWLRDKRVVDRGKKKSRERYGVKEDRLIVDLYNMCLTTYEIAVRTGRTTDAIKHRISKLRKDGLINYKNAKTQQSLRLNKNIE